MRLTFYIFLLYRKVKMTLSLSSATFCRPNSSFAFDFLQHHVHAHHRRDYDELKAVVVVWASLIRETHEYASVENAFQRLRHPIFKCGLQSRAAYMNFWHDFVRLTIKVGKQSSYYGRHIMDYWKKQTRTLRINENINFTNDDVMKYVIGASLLTNRGALPT